MNKKIKSVFAIVVLSAFITSNVLATTEKQALVRLDGDSVQKQAARMELITMVRMGIPVIHAYEIVSSAIEQNYSDDDIREVSAEVRALVHSGMPVEQVIRVADRAIDAGYSATDTQKALNGFEKRIVGGMSAKEAYARHSSEVSLKTELTNKGPTFATGTGSVGLDSGRIEMK